MNNLPLWEIKHNWWIEDFTFLSEQKRFFLALLRKYAEESNANNIKDIIKIIDKTIQLHQKEYKKIYGTRFNLNRVRPDRD